MTTKKQLENQIKELTQDLFDSNERQQYWKNYQETTQRKLAEAEKSVSELTEQLNDVNERWCQLNNDVYEKEKHIDELQINLQGKRIHVELLKGQIRGLEKALMIVSGANNETK